MKDVSIKIHRLGMIGESDEVLLNRLMLFSGESGLGKSYLSIICNYVFRVLLDKRRISSYFDSLGLDFNRLRPGYHGHGVALRLEKSAFEKWLSSDAIIWLAYMVGNKGLKGDIEISLPSSIPSTLEMFYDEEMAGLGNNVDTYVRLTLPGLTYSIKDSEGITDESPYAFLFRFYLIQEIFGHFQAIQNCFVFPPSRGTVLTEAVSPATGMYIEFQDTLRIINAAKPDKVEVPSQLLSLLRRVMDGQVSRRDGNYVYSTNGAEMPLSAAAASIRELASIELLVENTDISKVCVMLDEPEAHLHPLKQRMMADVVSCLLKGGAHIQITTHSDYFLRRLNELVLKQRLYDRSRGVAEGKEYYDMCNELRIDPSLRLDMSMVSAYLLERCKEHPEQSVVVRQDLSSSISYASFHDALDESLRMKYELEKRLSNGSNEDY